MRPCSKVVGVLASLVVLACGPVEKGEPEAAATRQESAAAPSAPQPYSYPAPVSGHYAEVNTGEFDLADGIAWSPAAGGTVLYTTSKPIASPLLSDSCPMTEARALTVLRDAGWVEVTIEASGKSKYFGAGTPLGGTSREEEVGGRYWTIDRKEAGAGRVAGAVVYKGRGGFDYDLPTRAGAGNDISEAQRMDGGLHRPGAEVPDAARVEKSYAALRAAARAGDLRAFLEAQGFDAARIASIRGLTGIEADWKRLANRFLEPGTVELLEPQGGGAAIGARGKNAEGAEFYNYYHLMTCGDRLLLVAIGENPQ